MAAFMHGSDGGIALFERFEAEGMLVVGVDMCFTTPSFARHLQ